MHKAVFVLTLLVSGNALASDTPASNFMRLTPEQRYYFIHGAVLSISHLIALRSMSTGECISGWYLKDKAARQKLIEDTITRYPSETPTTIVISLLTQACGELVPAK